MYLVGDRVKIIEQWLPNSKCKQNSLGKMDRWLGKVMTIRHSDDMYYLMEEDNERYCWNSHCIVGFAYESEPNSEYEGIISEADIALIQNAASSVCVYKERAEHDACGECPLRCIRDHGDMCLGLRSKLSSPPQFKSFLSHRPWFSSVTEYDAQFMVAWARRETVDAGVETTCAECGAAMPAGSLKRRSPSGELICIHCFQRKYFKCSSCHQIHPITNHIKVGMSVGEDSYAVKLCPTCLEEGLNHVPTPLYFRCQHCDQIFSMDCAGFARHGKYYCKCCAPNLRLCAECGGVFREQETEKVNREHYCSVCIVENRSPFVNRYSYKPDPIFHRLPREKDSVTTPTGLLALGYMGVELEIDLGQQYTSCQTALHSISTLDPTGEGFYLKHDGSLTRKGMEIVTHPCSLRYHMTQFPWDKVIETAHQYGYHSDSTTTCGLHVHVNRYSLGTNNAEEEATVAKVILMVDRFWDQLSVFARRDLNNLHWAQKPNAGIKVGDAMPDAISKMKRTNRDRYRAVNLQNEYTIEFRIFKGTLNKETLLASLQLVQNLCEFARRNTLNRCLNVPWKSAVAWKRHPELVSYLTAQNLYS